MLDFWREIITLTLHNESGWEISDVVESMHVSFSSLLALKRGDLPGFVRIASHFCTSTGLPVYRMKNSMVLADRVALLKRRETNV